MGRRRRSRALGIASGERARNAVLAIGAQALSGLSNFGVQVALALTLAPARFGALVVGFAVYYFALALVRAFVGDPLVALGREDRPRARASGWRGDALWSALRPRILLIAGGAVVLIGGLALAVESVRSELIWLALATPGLLLQDGLRSWCWARSRPGLLLAIDATWVIVSSLLFSAVVFAVGVSTVSGTQILLAWALGGLLSALVGWRAQLGLTEPIDGADGQVAADRELSVDERTTTRVLGSSQAVLAVDANGLPAAVAAVGGPTVSGGMRAASLPFIPVVTVIGALRLLTLPMLRRATIDGHVRRTAAKVTVLTASVAGVLVAPILVLLTLAPDAWLGPTGQLVRPWFLAGAIIVSARMIALPLSDALSLGSGRRRVLRLRVGTTMLDWTATLTGAYLGGLSAVMQARSIAAVLAALVWGAAVVESAGSPSDAPFIGTGEESEPYVVA